MNLRVTPSFNPSFEGVALAQYSAATKTGTKPLTVYKLEIGDLEYLDKLIDKLASSKLFSSDNGRNIKNKDVWRNITLNALRDAINSLYLSKTLKLKDKSTVSYLAAVENEPCGILVGNMPKITNDCKRIVFSRRDKAGDTELNWISTWDKDIKGAGAALMGEFFAFCTKNPEIESIYISASLLNRTNARKFYDKMGFELAQKRNVPLESITTPRELIKALPATTRTEFKPYKGRFYPLEMTVDNAKKKLAEISKVFQRQKLPKESVDLMSTLTI